YKSTDGGTSWIRMASPLPQPDVRAIAVDPTDAKIVYRSDYSIGISKSTDGGEHWNLVSSARGVLSFAMDPNAPGTLYAGSFEQGILKTTDGGATWAHADAGIPAGVSVLALALDPASPARLHAGTEAFAGLNPSYSGV